MDDVKQVDPFHVKGPDGVIRSLDEHYDGMQDVAKDPYGAWLAIQNLCARLEAVEVERDELEGANILNRTAIRLQKARAERAEAALALRNGECEAKKIIIAQLEATLATARRDAELLNKIVLPMVEQRSREQKDAWDQAAAAIRALANEAET